MQLPNLRTLKLFGNPISDISALQRMFAEEMQMVQVLVTESKILDKPLLDLAVAAKYGR